MHYHYYKPPPAISSCVDCVIEFEDDGSLGGKTMNIVPNGLAEIAIHYGDIPHSHICNSASSERGYLYGPTSKTGFYLVNGITKCICILFTFYGAYRLLGYHQSSLLDNIFGLEEICGKEEKGLIEQIVNAPTSLQRKMAVEFFLIRQFYRNSVPANSLLDLACSVIHRSGGIVRISDLCTKLKISEITLQRMFHTFLGLTPKKFSRIIRINRTFKYMKSKEDIQSMLALYFGYYDQSHFIREFRTFTGYSPQALYNCIETNVVYLNRMYTIYPNPVKSHTRFKSDCKKL